MISRVSKPSTELSHWCAQHLGSPAVDLLFTVQKLSFVTALRLDDGRRVVVKARRAEERVRTCAAVQRLLWERGFPCPQPLAGPAAYGDKVATAEVLIEGGDALARDGAAPLFARALAMQVALAGDREIAGTLEPVPLWVNWDHPARLTWPPDPVVELNARPGPDWLDGAGESARERLRAASALPKVIGHADWESQNLRWRGRELHVAFDWDSLVRRPEAIVAGMAALMFPSTGPTNEAATVDESDAFLAAYQDARGRAFTRDELEVAWAAGLWIGAWKAKKKALRFGDTRVMEELEPQAAERLRRSGA